MDDKHARELQEEMQAHNDRMKKDGVRVWDNRIRGWRTVYANSYHYVIFETLEEADLWMNEILGQLSDGKYESRWGYDLACVYANEVYYNPKAETKFERNPGGPYLSFTSLFDMYSESDPDDVRGRYSQKEAKALFRKITKAYQASIAWK